MQIDFGKGRLLKKVTEYAKAGGKITTSSNGNTNFITMKTLSSKIYHIKEFFFRRIYRNSRFEYLDNKVTCTQLIKHRLENIERMGNYIVGVDIIFWLNEDLIHRDSLNPNSQGVDNIIKLLNNGWKCSLNTPSGKWHGIQIKGLAQKQGTGAVANAVDEFNEAYSNTGFSAELLDKEYRNG